MIVATPHLYIRSFVLRTAARAHWLHHCTRIPVAQNGNELPVPEAEWR